ncbi:alpha/beta fold hydrolase [Dactylosporangium sp. CA-233914]|uniref:alpha/beta fold hydrolase n=1 Tax=Dactylosporangium sp. CA-233914 TaxID=3239934 RepID=UPI003D8AF0D6
MRDDVLGFMDALDLRRAALVGHSMGGMVAYLVAAERPDLLEHLVLEETPAPLPSNPPRTVPDRPEHSPFDWAVVEAVSAQRNRPDPTWWERLAQLPVPVLVVAGGQASHLPQEEQRALAERFPAARLVTIDAGHLVHETRPGTFTAVVTRFLDG